MKLFKKDKKIIAKLERKKTWYLKTAIIDNECIPRLNKDIFDGPKYLIPRIESISFKFSKFFITEPEKVLHKLALSDRVVMSCFVKQL